CASRFSTPISARTRVSSRGTSGEAPRSRNVLRATATVWAPSPGGEPQAEGIGTRGLGVGPGVEPDPGKEMLATGVPGTSASILRAGGEMAEKVGTRARDEPRKGRRSAIGAGRSTLPDRSAGPPLGGSG